MPEDRIYRCECGAAFRSRKGMETHWLYGCPAARDRMAKDRAVQEMADFMTGRGSWRI